MYRLWLEQEQLSSMVPLLYSEYLLFKIYKLNNLYGWIKAFSHSISDTYQKNTLDLTSNSPYSYNLCIIYPKIDYAFMYAPKGSIFPFVRCPCLTGTVFPPANLSFYWDKLLRNIGYIL